MKIWQETSGDHSAKLRIIGTFKTIEDAKKAQEIVEELSDIACNSPEPESKHYYAKEVLDYLTSKNISISPCGIETFKLAIYPKRDKNVITTETDEIEIQGLLEAFIFNGGKVEVYSRHFE